MQQNMKYLMFMIEIYIESNTEFLLKKRDQEFKMMMMVVMRA